MHAHTLIHTRTHTHTHKLMYIHIHTHIHTPIADISSAGQAWEICDPRSWVSRGHFYTDTNRPEKATTCR